MKYLPPVSRRRFLKGAGVAVGLPFLPSLDTKAYGADASVPSHPNFYWLATDHGGVFETSMFPSASLLNQDDELYSDHPIRWGQLQTTGSGADTQLSTVLRGAGLTPSLVGKMNVLHGIDVPWYISHNTGQALGNFARNDGNGNDGRMFHGQDRPTIDQIMAWSDSFYPDLSNLRTRSMIMSSERFSYGYSNPSSQSGTVQPLAAQRRSLPLFEQIFVEDSGDPTPNPEPVRRPVIDRVMESYRRLRDGNRRLGSSDRARLDAHVDWLNELERKLGGGSTGPLQSCGDVEEATQDNSTYSGNNPQDYGRYAQLYNDVVVAAFACGSSRIGVMGLQRNSRAVSFSGDWHQSIAHQWSASSPQQSLTQAYQFIFENVYLDLATKLDSFEVAPGRTLLDDTLMGWSQESGQETHWSTGVPVVTFGGAAGCFNTGRYIDYRQIGNPSSQINRSGPQLTLGTTYNRLLGTLLQAMRVPPAEYERWGHRGYGHEHVAAESFGHATPYRSHYQNTQGRHFRDGSVPLPVLWKG